MALASLPSLPSLSSGRPWKYDVFLSFLGRDTRKGFTSELHRRLKKKRIETFMAHPSIQVGDIYSPTLEEAIKGSRFAIIILSPNYASSTLCLQELSKICQCMEPKARILPLFFDLNYLKTCFEAAFTNYENSGIYNSEKLQEWRHALTIVANLSGIDLKDYETERDLIKKIVEDMYSKVQPIENNKGNLEATTTAMNKADVVSGVNVSGGKISGSNVNLGEQDDSVNGVSGDFIKNVSTIIKGGPSSNNIHYYKNAITREFSKDGTEVTCCMLL